MQLEAAEGLKNESLGSQVHRLQDSALMPVSALKQWQTNIKDAVSQQQYTGFW